MSKPPQDGAEERDDAFGEAQSDPDRMLTQPVQFYDRPPAPPGVQPYGPAAAQYGQQPGTGAAGQERPYGAPQPYGRPQPYGPQFPPPQYGPPGSFAPGSGATRPKKSRLRLLLGLAALALLLVIAMVLADALGPTVLDRAAVERDVAVQFEERHGVAIDLTCDEQMLLETGGTYECTGVTADRERVTLQIEVTDENFATYTWTEP